MSGLCGDDSQVPTEAFCFKHSKEIPTITYVKYCAIIKMNDTQNLNYFIRRFKTFNNFKKCDLKSSQALRSQNFSHKNSVFLLQKFYWINFIQKGNDARANRSVHFALKLRKKSHYFYHFSLKSHSTEKHEIISPNVRYIWLI